MDTYTIRRITLLNDERLEMEETTIDETTFRTILWESKSWKLRKTTVDRAYYGTERMPEYDTAVSEDTPINPDDMLMYEGRFYGIQLFGDFDFLLVNERRYLHDGTRAPHHLASIDGDSYSLWGQLTRVIYPFVVSPDGTTILKYFGKGKEVVIPEGILAIEGSPFWKTSIERIVFPLSLERLSDDACSYASDLKEVVIPDGCHLIEAPGRPYYGSKCEVEAMLRTYQVMFEAILKLPKGKGKPYYLRAKQDFDRLLGPFKDRFQGMSALQALEEQYKK